MTRESSVYLLDSNVFIDPKNRFYPFDYCPAYWDFLLRDFAAGGWSSIRHVYDEVKAGKDELSTWMQEHCNRGDFIDCENDAKVVER